MEATAQWEILPSRRIPELDGLRGLAILLVILDHYIASASNARLGLWPHRALSLFTVGWSGVDLFFVLSGFLIGGILLDARDSPTYFRTFYMRRVFRILPVYYTWILLYALTVGWVLWRSPGWLGVSLSSFKPVLIQVLFLQNMQFGTQALAWAWFGVTWSLAVDEQFYLIAPPLIRFLTARRLFFFLMGTICAAPILRVMVSRIWMPGTTAASFLMPCRADALACGILLAMAWRSDSVRRFLKANAVLFKRILLGLLGGVLALLWWLLHPSSLIGVSIGYTWMALFYACLLVVTLTQEGSWIARAMRNPMLRRLGTISYCVYILHYAFNLLMHRLILHGSPEIFDAQGVGVTLLALMLTIGVASLSWRYFERPLIERGHRYLYWQAGKPGPGTNTLPADGQELCYPAKGT
jgi:peptidoglycan/LPS O-acetylase OafA/YrhL